MGLRRSHGQKRQGWAGRKHGSVTRHGRTPGFGNRPTRARIQRQYNPLACIRSKKAGLSAVVRRISEITGHSHEHHFAALIGCSKNHVAFSVFRLAAPTPHSIYQWHDTSEQNRLLLEPPSCATDAPRHKRRKEVAELRPLELCSTALGPPA